MKHSCYLHGTNAQVAGVNNVPYRIQHFLHVPMALRQRSIKLILAPIQRIRNHKVYIKQGWLRKITLPFVSLTYKHPSSLPSFSLCVSGEFYGHSTFPRAYSHCTTPVPTLFFKGLFHFSAYCPLTPAQDFAPSTRLMELISYLLMKLN